MATIRHHTRIAAPADEVWAVVSDPAGITEWFPGIDGCTFDGEVRHVSTMGMEIGERVITDDGDLRRFQYSMVSGPMVPEHHLCTVDVLEDGTGSLVIYSCDVSPDEIGELMGGVYESATEALKTHLEK